MISCPKCGSNRVMGPWFKKVNYNREVLRYKCGRCGYEKDEPCLDAEQVTCRQAVLDKEGRELHASRCLQCGKSYWCICDGDHGFVDCAAHEGWQTFPGPPGRRRG